ncbi:MAG: preprotein translocase subunit YajC [Thermodesulfobacteriota bacterium]
MIDLAYAMAPGGGQGAGQSPWGTFVMLGAIFAIFYFLMIRPQQKRQRQHREMLASLKKGDTVITGGGLIGKVTGITDSVLTLEVADRVRVKVLRSAVSSVSQQPLLGETSDRRAERKKSKEAEGESAE